MPAESRGALDLIRRPPHHPGMDRRRFLLTSLAAAVAAPPAAEAQPGRQPPRVAFITTTSPENSTSADAFRQRLSDLGYVEGQNIVIEWRWGRGKTERFLEFADEVVRIPVDIIVAANTPAGLAAKRATRTIPIVIATMVDPVGDGFVASLARPGGNITGLTLTTPEMTAKRLQLLKEAIPTLSRVAYLADKNAGGYKQTRLAADTAARSLGVRLQVQEVGGPDDLNTAFASMIRQGAEATLVPSGTMLYANRVRVAELAQKRRLPTICAEREHAEAGCLISYGARIRDVFRRAANLVDRILKGTRPADLPVEEPTTFELIINSKTAKALGLTIPPSLLARVDQVIE